jgi:hypothetical protein
MQHMTAHAAQRASEPVLARKPHWSLTSSKATHRSRRGVRVRGEFAFRSGRVGKGREILRCSGWPVPGLQGTHALYLWNLDRCLVTRKAQDDPSSAAPVAPLLI